MTDNVKRNTVDLDLVAVMMANFQFLVDDAYIAAGSPEGYTMDRSNTRSWRPSIQAESDKELPGGMLDWWATVSLEERVRLYAKVRVMYLKAVMNELKESGLA